MVAAGIAGGAASEVWLRVSMSERVHSTPGSTIAVALGVGVALLAAGLAIRATFRAPTVEAMRPTPAYADEKHALLRPFVAGVLLIAATWLIALAPTGLGLAPAVALVDGTHASAFAGAAACAPALVALVGGGLRRLAPWSPSLPARLAMENLPRSPERGGATVATIGAAMGIAVALGGVVESFQAAWLGWMDQHFTADLLVGGGGRVRLLAGPPMARSVATEIAGVAGVWSVEGFRVVPIRLGDRNVFLQGISVEERLAHGGLPMVEGTFAAAAPALRAGTGVLLSDHLAYRLGLHRGDTMILPTPAGPRPVRVEGTFVDFMGSLDLGAVAVADGQLAALWRDTSANLYRVWLAPGARAQDVRAVILQRLGPHAGYYVLTGRQFVDGVRAALNQFFRAAWALVVVAAAVGAVGIVNTQLASVLDRRPEITMLRTIGLPLRDLTRSVVLECGVLGALGAATGTVLGAMLGAQMVLVSLRLITGWRIPFVQSTALLVVGVAGATVVSALAGWAPARVAARVAVAPRNPD
jgi:putative ABC transport system permease protein